MGERRACYLKVESELLQVTEKVEVFLFHFGCFILYKEVNWDQTLNMIIIDNKGWRMLGILGKEQPNNIKMN